jgi:amino acid permease
VDRARWAWTGLAGRLESLPPFWSAYSLTLTETVGAGILALPIALAGVGPLPSIAVLVLLGALNVLTIAAMAEAVSRNGGIRYGRAFFGRMVADYLGGIGTLILSVSVTAICVIALLVFYIGLSTTLSDATTVPPWFWAMLLFAVATYFLWRDSLSATVASALAVGAVTVSLILLLSVLALAHLRPENLLRMELPVVGGRPLDVSILRLVFGVVLLSYFGHLSLGNCARVVLQRDPSGRSLVWGAVAAQVTAIGLYCVWVVAVNSAIPPERLQGLHGTALAPLAEVVGPGVHLIAGVFVVVAMGMQSVHYTIALGNLVRERLPSRAHPAVVLARGAGRLVFEPRAAGGATVGLRYLGRLDGEPRFRLDVQAQGAVHHYETAVTGRWDATDLIDRITGAHQGGIRLGFEVLEAGEERVHLRLDSSMVPTYGGRWDAPGLRPTDVLSLSDDDRELVNLLVRRGESSAEEVAASIGQERAVAGARLTALAAQGFIASVGDPNAPRYRAALTRTRGRALTDRARAALDADGHAPAEPPRAAPRDALQPLRAAAAGAAGQFLLSLGPGAAIFALAEWLFFTGSESFTEPLGVGGLIVGSILAGLFPVLLLISSERKSDFVLNLGPRLQRFPVVKLAIFALFLAGLLLHGLVIWQGTVERLAAVLAAILAVAATIVMARRGAFTRRVVVELRGEGAAPERAAFFVTSGGQPYRSRVHLDAANGKRELEAGSGALGPLGDVRSVRFDLPRRAARELKVWAHRLTPGGESEAVPALLTLVSNGATRSLDLALAGGQVVLPLGGGASEVTLTLSGAAE